MSLIFAPVARAVACLLAGMLVTGCATVTRGTSQNFTVESEPSGAAVTTTNGFQCEATPRTFRMPRRSEFDVTVTREGYQPSTSHVGNRLAAGGAAGVAGNVLIGGVIGIGVDAASGAALDLTPNPLRVVLVPEGAPPASDAPAAPMDAAAPADAGMAPTDGAPAALDAAAP
jgi:hypothetical protein